MLIDFENHELRLKYFNKLQNLTSLRNKKSGYAVRKPQTHAYYTTEYRHVEHTKFVHYRHKFMSRVYEGVGGHYGDFTLGLKLTNLWKTRFLLQDFNAEQETWGSCERDHINFSPDSMATLSGDAVNDWEFKTLRSAPRAALWEARNPDFRVEREEITNRVFLPVSSLGDSEWASPFTQDQLLRFAKPSYHDYYRRLASSGGGFTVPTGGDLTLYRTELRRDFWFEKNEVNNPLRPLAEPEAGSGEVSASMDDVADGHTVYFKPQTAPNVITYFESTKNKHQHGLRSAAVLTRARDYPVAGTITSTACRNIKKLINPPTAPGFNLPMTLSKVQTLSGVNFVLATQGFFLARRMVLFSRNHVTLRFKFKKVYFSFLQPNQVKKAIMVQKRRIVAHRNVANFNRILRTGARFSYSYFSRFFEAALTNVNGCNRLHSQLIRTGDFFAQETTDSAKNLIGVYTGSRDEIVDSEAFNNRGVDPTFTIGEVRISRIKFKPGYQRIWRRVRTALKDSLRLRFIYQKQLTRYLTRFYWAARSYSFAQSDMAFDRIVLYSRLLPDMNSFETFMEAKLISLNGRLVEDRAGLVVPNDLIQLTVSVWYYIMFRWLANWTYLRNKKFRRLVFRKGLAGRYKLMKTRKIRSYYTPAWIYNVRYDISDVKPFLEVDYFSLSAFIIYDPYVTDYTTPTDFADVRVNTYSMYNWKYLT